MWLFSRSAEGLGGRKRATGFRRCGMCFERIDAIVSRITDELATSGASAGAIQGVTLVRGPTNASIRVFNRPVAMGPGGSAPRNKVTTPVLRVVN